MKIKHVSSSVPQLHTQAAFPVLGHPLVTSGYQSVSLCCLGPRSSTHFGLSPVTQTYPDPLCTHLHSKGLPFLPTPQPVGPTHDSYAPLLPWNTFTYLVLLPRCSLHVQTSAYQKANLQRQIQDPEIYSPHRLGAQEIGPCPPVAPWRRWDFKICWVSEMEKRTGKASKPGW